MTAVAAAILVSVGAATPALAGPVKSVAATATDGVQIKTLADGTVVQTFTARRTVMTNIPNRPEVIICRIETRLPTIEVTAVGPLTFERIAFDGVGYCDSQVREIAVTGALFIGNRILPDSIDSKVRPNTTAIPVRASTDCRLNTYIGHLDAVMTMPGGYTPPVLSFNFDTIPVFLACLSNL
ncbi:hypothetical protein [Paractinoplanes rishiriensis]|uniref:hypothetical protein n=1 Tax=Paractinoplanes rishiriensis TaxID=1050105 RepID=UPI0019414D6B|nr:hypothetical protein [Actinoplanes rishiriensis]